MTKTMRTMENILAARRAVVEVERVERVEKRDYGHQIVRYIPNLKDAVRYLNLAVGIEHIDPETVLSFAKGGFRFEIDPESINGYWQEVAGIWLDTDGYCNVAEERCGYGNGCFPVTEEYDFKRY